MRIRMQEAPRSEAFKRNEQLEELLHRLNALLSCANDGIRSSVGAYGIDHPLIFIMGPLRSGTTLFMQLLASTGHIAYPTNLLSRFYGAPLVGAQIQLLLTDPRYNFRNELGEFSLQPTFTSENGKTTGALSPNEFWYFWRRFLPFGDLDWLPDESLHRTVETSTLVDELVGLTRILGKPFALKGMILNYNIRFLDSLFERVLFVQLRRNPVANVASILAARKRQHGCEASWYSFKIPEYPQLKDLEPIQQAAGQLHFINRALTRGLESIPDSRKLVVDYEDLCEAPKAVMESLFHKLGIPAYRYQGPKMFSAGGQNVERRRAIEKALASFTDPHK
jgi:hypothetical protein